MTRISRLFLGLALGLSQLAAQSLLEQDLAYGFNLHGRILSAMPVIDDGDARNTLNMVFGRLAQTPLLGIAVSLRKADQDLIG